MFTDCFSGLFKCFFYFSGFWFPSRSGRTPFFSDFELFFSPPWTADPSAFLCKLSSPVGDGTPKDSGFFFFSLRFLSLSPFCFCLLPDIETSGISFGYTFFCGCLLFSPAVHTTPAHPVCLGSSFEQKFFLGDPAWPFLPVDPRRPSQKISPLCLTTHILGHPLRSCLHIRFFFLFQYLSMLMFQPPCLPPRNTRLIRRRVLIAEF